jgi:uncharacterized membrane protein (UPF0182 family)
VVASLLGLVVVGRLAAAIVLDRWWFESVTDAPVWATKVGAQILLAVAAGLVSGVVLIGSAVFAYRTSPAAGNNPNRIVLHYRERMGAAHAWALIGFSVFLTLRIAQAAMGRWQPWLLFVHGENLGLRAPDVGWDVGYHLFRLPLLKVVSGWLRQLVLAAAGFALVGHLANGALKMPRPGRKSAPRALGHLALLAAAFAAFQALDYIFVLRPGNATNQFGAFDGPGYVQVNVVLPSLLVLATVALACSALMLWAIRTRRWRAPLIAFGVWGVLQLVLIGALPAVVQRVVVKPAEAERQLPYIAHNLEATRTAFGLDSVQQVTQRFADGIDAPPAAAQTADLDRIPLFGENLLVSPLQVLQGTTGTRISDVDLDRYEIDGRLRSVLIAARDANAADIPERGWVQLHLVYTHGDGIVAVPADTTAPDGRPDVDALASVLAPERPELYFGEGLSGWYAIVGTKRTELGGRSFDADTGIALSSRLRRLVFSVAIGELEPYVSTELTPNSQLLYRRDIKERLKALAPFLAFDGNAYPVVADGRVTWVIDGYTTSNSYPYSQYARYLNLPGSSGLSSQSFNYVHASVKATVDAYDGTVHLYRTKVGGANDPVLDAWTKIFPGLVEPIADMPQSIRNHLLYPQDLLAVQTAMLGRYHVSDPETLFNGTDSWAISASAGDGVARGGSNQNPAPLSPAPAVSLFMPGTGDLGGHWVAIRPYGPGSATNPTSTRDELAAMAIADHDNPENLRLIRFEVGPGRLISSPQVAQSAVDTDRDLAALFTLLNANGSAVQFGPMTPIPLDGALIWARSIIVTGTAGTTTPKLYGVAVVSNGLVGEAGTVSDALKKAIVTAPAG